MKNIYNHLLLTAFSLFCTVLLCAQQQTNAYQFTTVVKHAATPVKNQANTGTCWAFSTTSFFESELLRAGKENTTCQKCLL